MKAAIAMNLLVFIGFTAANTVLYPRGCIYVKGKCHRECEVGTHAYTTGCGRCGPLTREATCEIPLPVEDTRSFICDYSACYCDLPTVRDIRTNKCINLGDCPKQELIPLQV